MWAVLSSIALWLGAGQVFEVQGPAVAGDWPVSLGVPMLPGEMRRAGDFAVKGSQGERVDATSQIAARWPDGSVRWAWVHTSARLDPSGRARLSVRPRSGRARPSANPVQRRESGRLTFGESPVVHVGENAAGLVRLGESGEAVLMLETRSEEGHWERASASRRRVTVLRAVPQRIDVAIEGRFESSGLCYRVWLSSFAAGGALQARVFLFAGDQEVQTASVRCRLLGRSLGWRLRHVPRPDRSLAQQAASSLALVSEPRTWSPGRGEHHVLLVGRGEGRWATADLSQWPPIALPPPDRFGRAFTGERGWRACSRMSSLDGGLAALVGELRTAVDWEDRGDWPTGKESWGNLEYDTGFGVIAHAVRSRRASWIRWADLMLSHLDGIDVVRVPPAGWPPGLPFRHGRRHRGALELGHVWIDGLWALHWITGDLWCRESATSMGEGLLEALTSMPTDRDIVRGAGWTLVALAAALRGTGEERFGEALRRELERVLGLQVPGRGCFDLPRERSASDAAWMEVTTWVQGGVLGEGLSRAACELGDRRALRALQALCEWIAQDAWSKRSDAFHVFLAYERAGPGRRRGALLKRRVEAGFLGATLARGLSVGGSRRWQRILDDVRSDLQELTAPFEGHRESGRPVSILLRCAPSLGL